LAQAPTHLQSQYSITFLAVLREMMDIIATSGSTLSVIVVVACVFVFLSVFWSDKTNGLHVTNRGWQKNRKKNNRFKKHKKVHPAQKKMHTMVIAHEETTGEAPLSDAEAPSLPLQTISSESIGEGHLEALDAPMPEVEGEVHSENSDTDSSCEQYHTEIYVTHTFNVAEERNGLTAEVEVRVHSESSEASSSGEQIETGIDVTHTLNVVEERDNNKSQISTCDRVEHNAYLASELGSQSGLVGARAGMDQESERTCEACANSDAYSWGCALHRTYASALLLAHRELRFGAAQNPVDLNLRLVSWNSHVSCPK